VSGERRSIALDATRCPAGVYFLRIQTEESATTRRVVVVR
jgi:hypothetical protein